jgi:hypothetical protein
MKERLLESVHMARITRRDFLKLAAVASLTPLLKGTTALPRQDQASPNILIILFDAMAAGNLSLYGYPRRTCPNIERFAARSTVYHNHHSAANFTTPSTATLFTGVYPWVHRAFALDGVIAPNVKPKNLFKALPEAYQRVVFAQNVFADKLFFELPGHIDQHMKSGSFSLMHYAIYNRLFPNDAVYGEQSYDKCLFSHRSAHGSLFLSIPFDLSIQMRRLALSKKYTNEYPNGLPSLGNTDLYFHLGQVMDGVIDLVNGLLSPSFTYIHLMPPHDPYMPTSQFLGKFADGWSPPAKEAHPLSPGTAKEKLDAQRQTYDEFIANLDAEFGRLLDSLETSGVLENSYVIVTSDHGEMFERGLRGHNSPFLYEPAIRIPLLIAAPGQRERRDIHALTSTIDLLPTLLSLAGATVPAWCEGRLLPGLGGEEAPERSIYALEAKDNPFYRPLTKATIGMIKGRYKLIHYIGYEKYDDLYELYDLQDDPEELHNLYGSHPISAELQAELDQKQYEADQGYR